MITQVGRELIRQRVDGFRPCPFCGGVHAGVIEGESFRWRRVQCGNCGCIGPDVRIDTLANDQAGAELAAAGAARDAWNKRAGA